MGRRCQRQSTYSVLQNSGPVPLLCEMGVHSVKQVLGWSLKGGSEITFLSKLTARTFTHLNKQPPVPNTTLAYREMSVQSETWLLEICCWRAPAEDLEDGCAGLGQYMLGDGLPSGFVEAVIPHIQAIYCVFLKAEWLGHGSRTSNYGFDGVRLVATS